jgi:hypothetical protein
MTITGIAQPGLHPASVKTAVFTGTKQNTPYFGADNADRSPRKGSSLADKAGEAIRDLGDMVEGILGALGLKPKPVLIPIPVENNPRPQPRKRRNWFA